MVRLSQVEWQELLSSLSEGDRSITLGKMSISFSEVQAQKQVDSIRHIAAVYGGDAAPPDDNPAWYWSAQIIP